MSSLATYVERAKEELISPYKIIKHDNSWIISRLNKQQPTIFLTWLSKELDRLVSFSGAKDNFSGESGIENTKDLIRLIVRGYGHFKISDVMLCFENAKLGKYGEIYRMDGMTILKWLHEYDQARNDAVRRHREDQENKNLLERSAGGLDVDKEGQRRLAEAFGKLGKGFHKERQEIKRRYECVEQYLKDYPDAEPQYRELIQRKYDKLTANMTDDEIGDQSEEIHRLVYMLVENEYLKKVNEIHKI